RKQRVAAGLGGFLLLVLAGSTGATLWGGRGDFASADFRVDDGFSQEVLGREATVSGGAKQASIGAQKSSNPISNSNSNSSSENQGADTAYQPSVVSQTNRINFPVNKFGIHAFAGADQVDLAAQLVNTNGGDWGWITLTMNISHHDAGMWNSVFQACKSKHIIPIIQLANDGAIPSDEQLESMANFLHSLEWPTRLRFISVFNEVNAAEYWGWEINPESYAQKLDKIIELLRGTNSDYFIMNGAFNASARTGHVVTDLGVETSYLSEEAFLQRMDAAVPGIFGKLDGWAAHCYPHPAYTSHPLATATPTLRDGMSSYKWELSLLAGYGVGNLPVFITETGWPHEEGATFHPEWHDQNTVAEYYKIAMRDLYGPDGRVVAVAPFVLKYDGYDNFAFVKPNGEKYPQWDAIVSLPKTAGLPPL
ncbi:MAG: hypothetical protein ABH814_03100, partial [bacterium]